MAKTKKSTYITVADVKRSVAEIEIHKKDDETAHGMEDRLWYDVLAAIAKGAPSPEKLAQAAIKTAEINFCRWCA